MKKGLCLVVMATALFFAACEDVTTGTDGKTSLIKTSDEPAGDNCPYGGIRIEAGIDENGNSTLDPNEVKDLRFFCNSTDGKDGEDGLDGTGCTVTDNQDGTKTITCGDDTTVTISDGANGADGEDCTVADNGDGTKTITCGGTEITVSDGTDGADGNDGNNGANGHNSIVVIEDAPAGTCPNGGQKVTIGIDLNDNDLLDAGEITATKYICDGVDGNDSLTTIDPIDPGEGGCVAGGYEVKNGVDSDGDGTLDAGEVVSDVFVCNGADGTNGTDGHSAMTETTPLAPGEGGCVAGGYVVRTGVDVNDNGTLDIGEYEELTLCNGEKGDPGDDGVCAGNHAPVITGITMAPPDGTDESYKLNVPYALTVTVTDDDDDTPTYKIVGGYATIVPGTTAGEFELTPRAEGGPFTYAIIVSDGCQITMGDLVIESVSTDPSGAPYFMAPPFIWFTDVIATGFTVNWDAARDDMTATEDLEYKVVYALDPEDIDTIEEIEAGNGIVGMDWTTDTYTAMISELEDGVEYSVVVVVRDEYHLMNMYIPGTQRTPDVTLPTTDGTLWITDVTETTLSLSWSDATDNATAAEDLEFKVVYATDPEEIDTVQEVNDLMGDAVLVSWQPNIYLIDATDLTESETYYFTVAVRDSDGNVTLYEIVEQTMATVPPAPVTDLYAAGLDGRVVFRWTDPADADLDYLEITWTPNDPAVPVAIAPGAIIRAAAGMANDTEYTFTVTAVDGVGNRSTDLTVTATPKKTGYLYAITGANTANTNFYSVDPNTGTVSLIGDTGLTHATGLAFSPDGDPYLLISDSSGVTSSQLYSVDINDASTDFIGDIGVEHYTVPDLAFASDGTLYGWSEASDYLITLDIATGAATKVGDSGVDSWATGLAFAPNGDLFVKVGNEVWSIDRATGAGIYINDINMPTINDGGTDYSELHNALDFSTSGLMFSVMRTGSTTYLFVIDPVTLVAIPVGDMGVTNIAAVEFGPFNQFFSGIRQNISQADLADWNVCYTDTYADSGTTLASILTGCDKANLMLACRPVGSTTFTIAAWAPRADVTFDTGTDQTTTHNANGLDWYYNGSMSWGFLPAGATANKSSCDGGDGWALLNDPYRMCWHAGGDALSSGWRCGVENDNFGMTGGVGAWERVILQAD